SCRVSGSPTSGLTPMLLELERLQEVALQQPGAVRRHAGIKFQCPACAAEGHDKHQDNACLFNDGRWGCAWSKDTELGRAHWDAIGLTLGALGRPTSSMNGRPAAASAPPQTAPAVFTDDLGLISVGQLLGEPDAGPAWLVEYRLP